MRPEKLIPLLVPLLAGALQCKRDQEAGAQSSAPSSLPLLERAKTAPPKTAPPPALLPVGSTQAASGQAEPPPEAMPGSATPAAGGGKVGDWLETELYSFRLVSMRPCAVPDAQGGSTRTEASEDQVLTLGAEVEIKAKARLTVSPREVQLGSGATPFFASMDLGRKLEGCTPLVNISWLAPGKSVKGFVLFDLPAQEPPDLRVVYQPTRWGGAPHVAVTLDGCVSCADAPSRR